MSNISTDLQDVEKIIVLDYGSQYNQLISRRIRDIGVFSELKSHKISAAEVREVNPVGIILSGGPNSVYEDGSFDIDPEIFELGIPILGICYGMQLLTHKLGGKVVPAGDAGNREYGQSTLTHTPSALFESTPDEQTVLMSHGDAVTEIPADFVCTGTSADCPYAAIENPDKHIYGIQFHPEVLILYTEMISFVTLPLTFVRLKVTGQWIISLTCRSKKFVKPSVINVSFLVYQVVLTHLSLGFFSKKRLAIN
ncbi:GMP synthase [Streptococcus pneumoniae]|nr:GMP synthase [Streptococcus pneumoniae]